MTGLQVLRSSCQLLSSCLAVHGQEGEAGQGGDGHGTGDVQEAGIPVGAAGGACGSGKCRIVDKFRFLCF